MYDFRNLIEDLKQHLEQGILPFWLSRGIDQKYGGFLTCFDDCGGPTGDEDKYIVTQTRMIWGLSALGRFIPGRPDLLNEAKKGVDFFIRHFWDAEFGGWFWRTSRDGTPLDRGKVVYGQSFAIYALSEYFLATGDPRGLEYAEKTFDLLQTFCADTYRGGYYENLEQDWSLSNTGFEGGDRKSLDIHMHLMEAFTTLTECTEKEIHKRRLSEVVDLILNKMIHSNYGCGLNQFDLHFNPIPAIAIRRTWNAERESGEIIEIPADTTSYGHNLELAWLLNRAGDVLGRSFNFFNSTIEKLVDHALLYGFDHEWGGVYRDGPHNGSAFVHDKEFWQNSESLVGFLDAFERLGHEKYFRAFEKTWQFDKKYMINHDLGEWRQLVDKEGRVIVGALGNPWKAFYHTGRSVMESIIRLERLLLHLERDENRNGINQS